MSEDEQLFLEQMADVAPLPTVQRVRRSAAEVAADELALRARREAAVSAGERDPNFLREEGIEPLDPWFVLEFKRPGIQNGVFRKLKQGRYEAEARLDMHRMTLRRGRVELFNFIREAHQLGLRSVLVVHGKGERNPENRAQSILKGGVDHWLRELPAVQAFHSAQPHHGGTGAVYVLLRKSEERKQQNRERFSRGRVSMG